MAGKILTIILSVVGLGIVGSPASADPIANSLKNLNQSQIKTRVGELPSTTEIVPSLNYSCVVHSYLGWQFPGGRAVFNKIGSSAESESWKLSLLLADDVDNFGQVPFRYQVKLDVEIDTKNVQRDLFRLKSFRGLALESHTAQGYSFSNEELSFSYEDPFSTYRPTSSASPMIIKGKNLYNYPDAGYRYIECIAVVENTQVSSGPANQ